MVPIDCLGRVGHLRQMTADNEASCPGTGTVLGVSLMGRGLLGVDPNFGPLQTLAA